MYRTYQLHIYINSLLPGNSLARGVGGFGEPCCIYVYMYISLPRRASNVCMYVHRGGVAEAAFSMHNTNTYLGATRPYNNNNKKIFKY